ncbi:MAG: hypothetical protein IJ506_01915 [Clostridia bacterium]|nr:hypothetical protein [Clostridia bacterium]
MRTGVFKNCITFFCVFFIFAVVGYCCFLNSRAVIALDKDFYFLTIETQTVEASAIEIKRDGGAGFLLKSGKSAEVALSVYFSENEGNKIADLNKEKYEDLKVTHLNCGKLYLKRSVSNDEAKKLADAFDNLYGHILLLNEAILRLDNGQTQEASKRILKEISDNFGYLKNAYAGKYKTLASLYAKGEEALEAQIENIVFAKDLRYLLCELSKGYIDFAGEYSL